MAKKDPTDLSVEEKLKTLYELQTTLSSIDEKRSLRGELPLEVQDLEDETEGLTTRMEKIQTEIDEFKKAISQKKADIANAESSVERYKKQLDEVKNLSLIHICNGCLEAYCSATGVARTARELLETTEEPSLLREMILEDITSLDVSIAAEKGDKLAQHVYQTTGEMLGEACANFAAFSSPEAFIFFGGLTKAGDLLMKPLKESYDKNVLDVYKRQVWRKLFIPLD